MSLNSSVRPHFLVAACFALVVASCTDTTARGVAKTAPAASPLGAQTASDPVLIGASDVAVCDEPGAAQVADRIARLLE